jgi:ATP-dependent Clp protease ATP-binding subunit ClpA
MTEAGRHIKGILERGRAEARRSGSAAVEAEHLLLALAAQPGTSVHRVLAAAELGRDAILVALDREFAASLRAAGVELSDFDLPVATADPQRVLGLGSSAKLVLERAVRRAGLGPGRIRPAHLLLGVLEAEVGTVPRALALAGVDRVELVQRTRAALSAEEGR